MPKFAYQVIFSIALTKINLIKSPWPLNSDEHIHVSCKPGFFFKVFPFFLQVKMPLIIHEALRILLHPMNKIQYA